MAGLGLRHRVHRRLCQLAYLATPLLLASPWALLPALFLAGVLIVRTRLEDQTLQAELPGYAAYAQRVRRRLAPGIW